MDRFELEMDQNQVTGKISGGGGEWVVRDLRTATVCGLSHFCDDVRVPLASPHAEGEAANGRGESCPTYSISWNMFLAGTLSSYNACMYFFVSRRTTFVAN